MNSIKFLFNCSDDRIWFATLHAHYLSESVRFMNETKYIYKFHNLEMVLTNEFDL